MASGSGSIPSCFKSSDNTFGPAVSQHCRSFDFTLLFEQIFVSLVPSLLLIIFGSRRVAQIFKSSVKTLPTNLHTGKLFISICYACIQLILLVLWCLPATDRTSSSIPAAVFALVAGFLLCLLTDLEHRKSVQPSKILNLYLFSSIALDAIQVRTLWMIDGLAKQAAVLTASTCLKTILLGLEGWEKRSFLLHPYNGWTPEALSSVYNRSTFWWLNTILLRGFREVLAVHDLYDLGPGLLSANISMKTKLQWNDHSKAQKHGLLRCILAAHRRSIFAPVVPRLLLVGLKYSQPFLLRRLVTYLGGPKSERQNENFGYGLMGATALVYFGIAVVNGRYQHAVYRSITVVRASLVSLIYNNMLATSILDTSDGQEGPITLMSTDVDAICGVFDRSHELWASLLETVLTVYLLASYVGAICVIPVALATVSAATNTFWVGKAMGPARRTWNQAIQRRIQIISSTLRDVKGLKLLALSNRIGSLVQDRRIIELRKMRGFRILSICMSLVASVPSTLSIPLILTFYYALNHSKGTFTAAGVYYIWSLVDLMTGSVVSLLNGIPSLMSSRVCFTRIQEFLAKQTIHESRVSGTDKDLPSHGPAVELSVLEGVSKIRDMCAIELVNWSVGYSQSPVLADINACLEKGNLTIVAGPVGSGKTTFLLGLLGETRCFGGCTRIPSKSIGYCSQSSWLVNDTFRNNVVAQSPPDDKWYLTVVKACALDVDISRMSSGHDTLVGSRGVVLSGGQKQRLALARAVYAKKDILLLDDVFSALDVKVGQRVFQRLLSPEHGLLRTLGTTVVLVTHSVSYLPAADQILVLNKCGSISEYGTFQQLAARDGYIRSLNIESSKVTDQEIEAEVLSTVSTTKERIGNSPEPPKEARRVGDFKVYQYYFQQLGWTRTLLLFIAQFVQAGCFRFPQIWAEFWTNDSDASSGKYIAVLFVFALGKWLANLIGTSFYWMDIIPRAGQKMHWTLLSRMLRAPFSYHASVDSGVTLNRFSQDMTLIDSALPMAFLPMSFLLFLNMWSFGYIFYGAVYLAAFLPLLIAALYCIQKFYLRTSRQMRLLDLEAKSPLFSHFTETFEGLITIRAFKWEASVFQELLKRLDSSQQPFYLLYCIQQWLAFSLDIFVAVVAVLLVTFATQFDQTSSGAAIGIAMLNVLSLSTALSQTIQIWTSLETSIGAISRLKQVENEVDSEEAGDLNDEPPPEWPHTGCIDFKDVSASYKADQTAIHRLTLSIRSGEKIGICGRTGSGKSTLVSLLARLLPTTSGTITIDDLEIRSLPLQRLRTSIVFIAQESFLIPASIRFNIAPHSSPFDAEDKNGEYDHNTNTPSAVSDTDIISALESVQLWDIVLARCEGDLSAPISSLNLSHGQKQLFCIARAILSKNTTRIIVLDEATSSMDKHTANFIRIILKREFSNHTVITIAHRLDSLLDCDRIVVMESGSIAEIQSAADLRATGEWTVESSKGN